MSNEIKTIAIQAIVKHKRPSKVGRPFFVGKLELGDEELSLPTDFDHISNQDGLLDVEVDFDPSREKVVLVIEASSQISTIRGFCKCGDLARA